MVTSGWNMLRTPTAQQSEAPAAPRQRAQKQPPQEQACEGTKQVTEDPSLGCSGDMLQALPKAASGTQRSG